MRGDWALEPARLSKTSTRTAQRRCSPSGAAEGGVRGFLPSVRACLMMAPVRRIGRPRPGRDERSLPCRTEVQFMTIHFWRVLSLATLVATLGFTGTAAATPPSCNPVNFSDNQYTTCFTDVRRGADINDDNAPDLGGTGHTALNFTGGAGPAGDTWLTKWTPNGGTRICIGTIIVEADVLIHTYNNTKGAGLVSLLN